MNYFQYLKQLLLFTIKLGASDLHLLNGHPPVLRISRKLTPLEKEKTLNSEDVRALCYSLMTEEQQKEFEKNREIDFSFDFQGISRFRINIYHELGSVAGALRVVPSRIRSIEELNLPDVLHSIADALQGFVLIVGPSSHGKSTTLAAIINEINKTRYCNIITIEDPIEYIFEDDKSIISQRELNSDTFSFAKALKATFREDPDVIMVGEMRDQETIATAITAAETGHLVFATLHTNSAGQTIHRIVDAFSGEQQNQVRSQLAGSLLAIISQRLIPTTNDGVIPACEIMFNNQAISNLIRENKIYEIPMVIDTSSNQGMISFNRALARLVKEGKVKMEDAINFSTNVRELKKLIMDQ
ncbi:MAG: type IV pilus twitching motility protein PilT [Candidatus Pacebacteria bacterium]|nr:type IV pilus twitching motility protein PilT [Candidatus Paceibacterota bacterium]